MISGGAAANKVVEVVAETTAPRKAMEDLFEAIEAEAAPLPGTPEAFTAKYAYQSSATERFLEIMGPAGCRTAGRQGRPLPGPGRAPERPPGHARPHGRGGLGGAGWRAFREPGAGPAGEPVALPGPLRAPRARRPWPRPVSPRHQLARPGPAARAGVRRAEGGRGARRLLAAPALMVSVSLDSF